MSIFKRCMMGLPIGLGSSLFWIAEVLAKTIHVT